MESDSSNSLVLASHVNTWWLTTIVDWISWGFELLAGQNKQSGKSQLVLWETDFFIILRHYTDQTIYQDNNCQINQW